MTPRWSILVCSVEQRRADLARQLDALVRLVEPHGGAVDVVVYLDDFDRPRHEARNMLVQAATGDYVSFVDDDDELPAYFVDRVIEALADDPDYVGWRMQCIWAGQTLKPTFHSLRYRGWSDDHLGYYRDISHLNPIRRAIAASVPFPAIGAEDAGWATAVAASGLVRTEAYIEDVMYLYRYEPTRSLQNEANRRVGERPDVALPDHPLIGWLA